MVVFSNDDVPGRCGPQALSQSPGEIDERAILPRDEYFMRLALREAERALEHEDVPIGAVVVRDGEVIAVRPQRARAAPGPTAHAEMIALREAAMPWAAGGCSTRCCT